MRRANLPVLSAPVSVELDITNACNLVCQYCRADAGKPQTEELPTARWIELVDELWSDGVRRFTVSGGEPFCKSGAARLFQHLGALGAEWVLVTNGVLIGEIEACQLRDMGVTWVQITW